MAEKKKQLDVLDIWKLRIHNESHHGDLKEAVRRSGKTDVTYYTGMKKAKIEDLTDREFEVISAYIEILDERKEKLEKVKRQYANG